MVNMKYCALFVLFIAFMASSLNIGTWQIGGNLYIGVWQGEASEPPHTLSLDSVRSYRTVDSTGYRGDTVGAYGTFLGALDSLVLDGINITPLSFDSDSIIFIAPDSLDTGCIDFVVSYGEQEDSLICGFYCLGSPEPDTLVIDSIRPNPRTRVWRTFWHTFWRTYR